MDAELRQSPMHSQHLELGAKMVPFAGWEMPVQYEGIIAEHKAVRDSLGVFDISHMGQVFVSCSEDGEARTCLDGLLTNNVASLECGQGQYTFLLNDAGGVIDDLIIYRRSDNEYFLVVNASKTEEDFEWLSSHLSDDLDLTNASAQFAGLAVQGPDAQQAFHNLFGATAVIPERFCMAEFNADGSEVIVCRTGYTGEDGYELFCPIASAADWWKRCLDAGATPAGLGARDTLRLEKCYPLNGNDLSQDLTPLEAGLGFAVDLHKGEFIGRETLIRQKTKGLSQRLAAIKQIGKSPPPRPGYAVYAGDLQVGTLSSGGVSPMLCAGISMGYLKNGHNSVGSQLEVEIRGKRFPCEVVKKPFV